jgi:hypothetical protein
MGGSGTVTRSFPNSSFVGSEIIVDLGQRELGLGSEREDLRHQDMENPWKSCTAVSPGSPHEG